MIMARSLPEEVTNGTLEGDIVPGDITFLQVTEYFRQPVKGICCTG